MAFDIEGARKAGYTDAEIAEHMAKTSGFDLGGAKKAGYTDGEVIAHLRSIPSPGPAIPGQEGEAARVASLKAAPGPTIAERAIGTAEAAGTVASSAVLAPLGFVGRGLSTMAQQILDGSFGTPEAWKLVEEASKQGAQDLTYFPRTEQGQDQVRAVGQAAQALVPVAGLAPQAAALSTAARTAAVAPARTVARAATEAAARTVAGDAGAAAAGKAIDTASRVADLAGKNVTTLPRRALERLRQAPEAVPTPGTMGSVGAAGTDVAAQRRALAADLPVPINLTKGQATRDAAQLKFETETAKLPEQGAPLRQRLVQQNEQILQNFDAWIDQTGAEAPSLRAVGRSVDDALVKQSDRDRTQIRVAYKDAEKAGELEAPVELQTLVQHLNDSAPDAATAPLLDVARRRALQLGIATEGADGALVPKPVTLRVAESYRQAINRATDYEATNVRQATIIKGLIDETTEGLGGDLYKRARGLRARYAQNYENRATVAKLLETTRGTTDRRVAFEDVFDHAILKGSLDDVRNVRRVLQRGGPEGNQAWRELQGATATWIRDEATKGVSTDGLGNRVISPAGLDKAIRTLDADGRLDFVFGKQGAQRMRDINELAKIARTVPPETAANNANTAMTLVTALLDAGFIGSTGGALPVPIATLARVTRQQVKDRALRRRIEDALGDLAKKAPNNKRNAPPVTEPPADATMH